MDLDFTFHARAVMARRLIPEEWVALALTAPGLRTDDPNDPEIERFFWRVPGPGERVLRVAVNTRVEPWRVVSVFLDRTMRGRL